MNGRADFSIKPRNGDKLVAVIVARISGCQNQKGLSLDDQVDHGKEIVTERYEGEVDYHIISTKGKGERLDRPELEEIEELIRSGKVDVIVVEDLGRLVRGTEAARLCGVAVDYGVRVLAPNDGIDTAEETWEQDVIEACAGHVGHNAHTSKRLKHKLMNRFLKFGGATPREIYGYDVPDTAKTYDDWQRDEKATPTIKEAARRLRQCLNCSTIADWLNAEGVPVGPYCRLKKWDGKMVRRYFANPLLKGQPGRGFKHTVKFHETGRRIAVENPKGPQYRQCPHLAHLDADEFDSLNLALESQNACYHRKEVNGVDPLLRRPRKRTVFPGQHARCWYCGREYVWGGNGMTENLMCSGPRNWKCWNSFGFPGALCAQRLVDAILNRLLRLDTFAAEYVEILKIECGNAAGNQSDRWAKLRRAEEQHNREKDNLCAAMAAYGPRPLIQEQLVKLETHGEVLRLERRQLETLQHRKVQLPSSIAELRTTLETEFQRLAIHSPEFGDLLRQLVPEIHVYLVRLCDGGHLLPRARVKLNLAGSFDDIDRVPALRDRLSQVLTIDLFDPPQREQIRVDAVQLAAQGFGPRAIAQRLPQKPTATAVSNALALQLKMQALGLADPFVTVLQPPEDYPKLRRHLNPRYQFTPLEGYVQPPLF